MACREGLGGGRGGRARGQTFLEVKGKMGGALGWGWWVMGGVVFRDLTGIGDVLGGVGAGRVAFRKTEWEYRKCLDC